MAADRGEPVSLMEPLVLGEASRHRPAIADLAMELTQKSRGLSAEPAAKLIEGHDTRPVDIERALKNDYSRDAKKRDLQIEARAHISVQRWIDEGGLRGRALSRDAILETHRRFCELLPEDLLMIEDPHTQEKIPVLPGGIRTRDVAVGGHLLVSPGAVPRFLERFERV